MQVLLIFSMLPDTPNIYLLELDEHELELAKKCDGNLINVEAEPEVEEALDWLDDYLDDHEDCLLTNLPIELTGTFTVISTGILG